jgi:hypothetical protein
MAITNQADYLAALRETKSFLHGFQLSLQLVYSALFLGSAANTTSGIVPVAGFGGSPTWAWSGGSKGYLSRVSLSAMANSGGQLMLADRLFCVGPFNGAGPYNLTGQPSYLSRCPDGTYDGLQIWTDNITNPGGVYSTTVTYTNELGVAGCVTSTVGSLTVNLPNSTPIPLAAGDKGVQKIESLSFSNSNAAQVQVSVVRPLAFVPVYLSSEKTLFFDLTGLPEIYNTSCICGYFNPLLTTGSGPVISLEIEAASK